MCVAFWTLAHPEYSLVLCTNRDEFLSRPTLPAHFHAFGTGNDNEQLGEGPVLSGTDLRAGGTWFGVNRHTGRIALLTNITEEYAVWPSSRGHLVSDFLLPSHPERTLKDHLDLLTAPQDVPIRYAGFNLLLLVPTKDGTTFEGALVTNGGGGGPIVARELNEEERCACGGVSNGVDGKALDQWVKLSQGKTALEEVLRGNPKEEDAFIEELFSILRLQNPSPPESRFELRTTIHVPPIHITFPGEASDHYGTRLSTVLLVHRDGRVKFIERDIWMIGPNGEPALGSSTEDRVFQFTLGGR